MATGIRAKLNAMSAAAGGSGQKERRGGLVCHVSRRDIEPGLLCLPGAGLRRIGWTGRAFDVRRCLFLDTETTGLSGGAGTVAFLVGVGYVREDCFVIEQYLMRDYSDEPELIDRLAERMAEFDCVCTFNGKAFDMPLLESRFTMCRMRHRWRELDNLDLLHPARRAWKLRLGSCRLCRLEEEVLGMTRSGDLPGSEVPQRYFEFLKTGDVTLLEDIVDHNRQDIATLMSLLVRLCGVYDEPESIVEQKDLFSVGKALEKQGEFSVARRLYRLSAIPAPAGTLQALSGERLAGMANWRGYLLARRSKDIPGMKSALEQMLTRRQMTDKVHTELSKLYEHQLRDLRRALYHAKAALEISQTEERQALERRVARIERKLERETGGR